jgi:zinc protease
LFVVAEGPSASELKAAKDNLIGNVADIAWHDLPLDYLDTWTTRMNAVTAADVKAAFARKLHAARADGDSGGGGK